MRISLVLFATVALVASSMTAASAFNYATLSARTVGATIVSDDGDAYLSIETEDLQYECYVTYPSGKVTVSLDAGTGCTGADPGIGVNAGSIYYLHDVLKVTNKGTKDLTGLWVNMTGSTVKMKYATAAGTMVTGPDTTSYTNAFETTLDIGDSIYLGFVFDASAGDTGSGAPTGSMTVAARSSN